MIDTTPLMPCVCGICEDQFRRGEGVIFNDVEYCSDECASEAHDDHLAYLHDADDYLIDGVGFADPGGRSALRAETPSNPRDQDCPTCGAESVLTRIDRQRGYQCDRCADRAEMGMDW